MADFQFIKDAVEDLSSLEVATLTNKTDELIPLKRELNDAEKQQFKEANDTVKKYRKAVLTALGVKDEKGKEKEKRKGIRTAKRQLREAEKQMSEVSDALGIYDPKDIFSQIRSKLNEGQLVAYSRFELEGDSINFINNEASVQDLVSQHKEMVGSSQEARTALFESVISVVKSGL